MNRDTHEVTRPRGPTFFSCYDCRFVTNSVTGISSVIHVPRYRSGFNDTAIYTFEFSRGISVVDVSRVRCYGVVVLARFRIRYVICILNACFVTDAAEAEREKKLPVIKRDGREIAKRTTKTTGVCVGVWVRADELMRNRERRERERKREPPPPRRGKTIAKYIHVNVTAASAATDGER